MDDKEKFFIEQIANVQGTASMVKDMLLELCVLLVIKGIVTKEELEKILDNTKNKIEK